MDIQETLYKIEQLLYAGLRGQWVGSYGFEQAIELVEELKNMIEIEGVK